MTQLPNINSTTSGQSSNITSALNQLDLDDFLKLMIAELQNQDPLNPLENDELLAQISQIREVGATEQLTSTLNAVLLGQNISSATNLIGADVVALDESGQRVSGNVRVVTISGGKPMLDLAIDTSATAAKEEGKVASGKYTYEVVWQSESGTKYGVEVEATTATLGNFTGAIQLNYLPVTVGEKRIYRTDRTGEGERKLVGVLPKGSTTTFIDSKSDAERTGDPITDQVNLVEFADKVTVPLSSVGEIRPPSN
jgi:flagellar basal-body rod modification protein FlgD